MRNNNHIRISAIYSLEVFEWLEEQGVPWGQFSQQCTLVEEVGVFQAVSNIMRIKNTNWQINLESMSKQIEILPELELVHECQAPVLILPIDTQVLVEAYCHQKEIFAPDLLKRIEFYPNEGLIPLEAVTTNLSVRSTRSNRKYTVCYIPNLLRYLHNPQNGIWMIIGKEYKLLVDMAIVDMQLDSTIINKHINWVEGTDFDIIVPNVTVRYISEGWMHLALDTFKATCLLGGE